MEIKVILKGIISSCLLMVGLLGIFALLLVYTELSEEVFYRLKYALYFCSIFCGVVIAAILANQKVLWHGLAVVGSLFIVYFLGSTLLQISSIDWWKIIFGIIAWLGGSLVGVMISKN